MTNATESSTTVDEIAAGIYRISTPIPPAAFPGGFTFNQFLVVDDEPLLFHTGMRGLFPLVRGAVARVSTRRACAGSAFRTSRPTSAAR